MKFLQSSALWKHVHSCVDTAFKKVDLGTSLVAQWLGLHGSTTGPDFDPWPGSYTKSVVTECQSQWLEHPSAGSEFVFIHLGARSSLKYRRVRFCLSISILKKKRIKKKWEPMNLFWEESYKLHLMNVVASFRYIAQLWVRVRLCLCVYECVSLEIGLRWIRTTHWPWSVWYQSFVSDGQKTNFCSSVYFKKRVQVSFKSTKKPTPQIQL